MTAIATLEGRGGVQVIARAASILRTLKNNREGLSLGQIATRVGLPRSTVQRIVGALEAEHLVMAARGEGGVRLGPELQFLGEAARVDFLDVARSHLVELSQETGETVDLAIPRGNALVFVDQAPGTQRLRAVSSVGETFPLTTTANGKAILSLKSDAEVSRIARAEWKAQGARKRSLEPFLAEIRKARASGLAYDNGEHTEGISAVGAAFADASGAVYAISTPTPSARFARNRITLAAALKRRVALITASLSPRLG